MVFAISQETFNEAVKENINDLGLSPEEAVEEAVNQFKAQGVDLSQVITDPGAKLSFETLTKIVTSLKENPSIDQINFLKQECDKGIQYKVQAGRAGAYDTLLNIFENSGLEKDLKLAALKTLVVLITKQPDVLDDRGASIILANVENNDTEIQKLILRFAKESCVMHEMNRQKIFDLNIVDKLTQLLNVENSNVLREVLGVLRALLLDDDVRVEFGRAHEHARVIAAESLRPITKLLNQCKSDEAIINDLMLTLSALLVRTEFCLEVEAAGGLDLIHNIMTTFIQNEKINRQCLKLIKALAGNDECKAKIIQKGFAPVIASSLNTHKGSVQNSVAGLHSIAALSLRNPENSKVLFEAGIPEEIVDIMKKHPNDKPIQKTGSWAVRNMVSRSRYQNPHFLELGVEEVLQQNLSKFKEFEYDIKAALRDLECDVELKEEWTGKGGKITTENLKKE